MAHDPFRGATLRSENRPRVRVSRLNPDGTTTPLDQYVTEGPGPAPTDAPETPPASVSGSPAGPTPDPPSVASAAQEEPQKPGYPCRLASCGQVLASPGALGGHMAAHRKRGELD